MTHPVRRLAQRVLRRAVTAVGGRPAQPALGPDERRRLRQRVADLEAEQERHVLAYRRLVAAVQGVHEDDLPRGAGKPNRKWVAVARQRNAEAALARRLRQGATLPEAVVASVRPQLRSNHVNARALCQSLYAQPETRVAGALGGALVAQRMELHDLAWDQLSEVPQELVARLAPAEYARTAVQVERRDALDAVASWVEDGTVTDPATLVRMAEVFFAAEAYAAADRALASALASGVLGEVETRRARLLQEWVARALSPAEPAPVPEGRVSFGVIDYKQPDESTTSSNLGDYVQTIASLGHLVRHDGLTFHGDEDLVDVVTDLHKRVRPELKIEGPGADVQLTVVNRDSSSLDAIPPATWMIAFGWYMQNSFGLRYDFPFHPNIRPLFISFHVNRPSMLTDEAVEYLKAHGPIGCRDWNTVHLLLNRGVPAFFSGCLTTTISTVFPDRASLPPAGAPTVWVDTPAPSEDALTLTQAREDVRWIPIAPNMREALELLESYRTKFGEVVTSRLHCYLPSWAIGANVTFTPRNRADVRFAGLLDADEDGLRVMQQRIRDLLAAPMARVVAGASEEEVYAEWRRVCEPEVAKARAAHEAPVSPLSLSFDVAEACRTARASRVVVPASAPRDGETVYAAVALDGNLKKEMEVVIGGMVRHSDRPLHVVALTRDHTSADHERLAGLFPEVTFEWIACDDIDYGPVLGMLSHITVSTMDRLLLPELLPDIERIVYHDIDALTVTDIAELYDVELEGAPLAARASVGHGVRSGLGNILRSGRRLSESPAAANEFYRTMYRRHPGDFPAFNAGILVLDLAVMRADGFTAAYVPYVEHYGLNDQEILNCYAGSTYRQVAPAWNNWPTQETVTDPKILHWAGHLKPWDRSRYVLQRERWDDGEAFVAVRRAAD